MDTGSLMEQFHEHSYGFRPNRCAQQAVLRALEMMNDGHSWIVDIDLAKFRGQMKKYTCRGWGVSNGYKVGKLNQLIRG